MSSVLISIQSGMVFTTVPFYRAETPAILRTSWETQTRISQRNTQGNQNESENLQKSVEESAEDLTDLTPPVTLSGKTLITPRLGASLTTSMGKRARVREPCAGLSPTAGRRIPVAMPTFEDLSD